MCNTILFYRTLFTFRSPVRNTHNCPQFNQSLVKIAGGICRYHLFQCTFYLFADALFHDIFIATRNSGNHPEHIAIHCRFRDSIGKCTDCPRRVIANSLQLQYFFISIRNPSRMINHDLLCRFLHISYTIIIS